MTSEKTVWHLLSNRWNSAITEYALSAATALEYKGWQNYFSPLSEKPAESRSREAKLMTLPYEKFGVGSYFKLREDFKTINPDYIFTYGGPETFLAGLLPLKKTKLIRLKGEGSNISSNWQQLRLRLSLKKCGLLICPSEFIASQLNTAGIDCVEIVILGCDNQKYYFSKKSFQPPKRPTLTIFGRLDPIKGHREFLKIFKFIKDKLTTHNPLLQIVGQEANLSYDDIFKAASEIGLVPSNDLLFVNERLEHPYRTMQNSHLGVVSSLGSEVICRVAEEFLLCGTRIAVSGVGGLDDTLIEESFGLSWKNTKPEKAAELIASQLIIALGETAEDKFSRAELAKKYFSLESMGDKLIEVLTPLR